MELDLHRQQHLKQLSVYRAIEQRGFQDLGTVSVADKFQDLTLRHGIRYEMEGLGWCDEGMQFLQVCLPDETR